MVRAMHLIEHSFSTATTGKKKHVETPRDVYFLDISVKNDHEVCLVSRPFKMQVVLLTYALFHICVLRTVFPAREKRRA